MKTFTGSGRVDIAITYRESGDVMDVDRHFLICYYGAKGLSWMEPGYWDAWQSSPTFRQIHGDVVEVENGLQIEQIEEDRIINATITFGPLRDASAMLREWQAHLSETNVTEEQEAERLAKNQHIIDGISGP